MVHASLTFSSFQISWMDEDTKKAALEKLANVSPQIAYPNELKDDEKLNNFYKDLEIVPDNYLKSKLNIKLFHKNYYLKQYHKPINRTDWVTNGNSAVVNAFYSPQQNSISK